MRTLIRFFGGLMCVASLALVLLGWVGVIVSDRWGWSQYISWVPGWMWLCASLPLCALGVFRQRCRPAGVSGRAKATKGDRAGSSKRTKTARASKLFVVAALCNLSLCVHVALVQLRVLNLLPARATPLLGVGRLTIAQWNATHPEPHNIASELADAFGTSVPDVTFVSYNRPWGDFAGDLKRHWNAGGNEFKGDEGGEGPATSLHVEVRGEFAVASRLPIKSLVRFSLRLERPSVGESNIPGVVRGEVLGAGATRRALEDRYNEIGPQFGLARRSFSEVENGDLVCVVLDGSTRYGRDLVIWHVDLPSDPFLYRWEIAGAVRRRLDELMSPATGTLALPAADVIVGDCNIPRSSASLERMFPGYHHAFDDAGVGRGGSWPRAMPLLHIDHCLLSPGLHAEKYGMIKPGKSDHMIQSATLVIAPK